MVEYRELTALILILSYFPIMGFIIGVMQCSGIYDNEQCTLKKLIGYSLEYSIWCLFGAGIYFYFFERNIIQIFEFIRFLAFTTAFSYAGKEVIGNALLQKIALKFVLAAAKKYGVEFTSKQSEQLMHYIDLMRKNDKKNHSNSVNNEKGIDKND